jgi:hypothetical protein
VSRRLSCRVILQNCQDNGLDDQVVAIRSADRPLLVVGHQTIRANSEASHIAGIWPGSSVACLRGIPGSRNILLHRPVLRQVSSLFWQVRYPR